ncbi:MAG: sugar transporter permease [Anaerocolumna sp.]|jgi:putative aldouronate transport system permease protein|nr:sugar transporter permease [Anaerocolumna sp.]
MKREKGRTKHPKIGRQLTFWQKVYKYRVLLLMCTPAILFFFIFSYIPMPGVYIAFTNFNYAKGIFGSDFIGFDNFKFLFTSGKITMLTRNSILYNIAFIILGNTLQIFVAILLNEIRSKYFKKVTQTFMFLPYFISAVLVGLLLYNLLNFDYGFINSIIRSFDGTPIKVYSNKHVWPFIIVLVHLWQQTGYGSIVYFAAIMGIDAEMIEAAKVDGVNAFQKIRYIILPNLKPTVVILLLFSMGSIIKGNFGLFYNIIGPSNKMLFPTTDIIETYVFRSMMNNFNFTQASAVGLYQSIFGFIVVMVCNWIAKKIDNDYALF